MLTLAVLFGGPGVERDVSCRSAYSLLSHIPKDKYNVLPIGVDTRCGFWHYFGDNEKIADGSWENETQKEAVFPIRQSGRGVFRSEEKDLIPDVVWPILHGDFGEDGKIQGLLSYVGMPYLGADTLGGALGFDKVLTKRVAESLGVPVTPWISVDGKDEKDEIKRKIKSKFGKHPFPLFIKPAALGSSVGARKVRSYRSLLAAVEEAGTYGEVLIESYVPKKRELEIAYLGGELPFFSSAGEIISRHGFYDYREKYENHKAKIGMADLPENVAARLYRYVKTLLRPLHVRDLCRFDFFLCEDGTLYFNEVNTMPGLTDVSLYPTLMSRAGITWDALIERWVGLALDRRI